MRDTTGDLSSSGHREIDHTADLGFEVWAPSEKELLIEATTALLDLLLDRAVVCASEKRQLEVTGQDPEERLVRWLQEVYLQVEQDLWLPQHASALEIDGDRIRGTVTGEPYDPLRHQVHTEIKAVTYHDLNVCPDSSGVLRSVVIVDV